MLFFITWSQFLFADWLNCQLVSVTWQGKQQGVGGPILCVPGCLRSNGIHYWYIVGKSISFNLKRITRYTKVPKPSCFILSLYRLIDALIFPVNTSYRAYMYALLCTAWINTTYTFVIVNGGFIRLRLSYSPLFLLNSSNLLPDKYCC